MHFDLARLAAADRYKLLAATITPRPIAWITSQSASGQRNAAPFSFFNMMSADPPILALGLGRRADGTHKDTAANILATGECVIHLVCRADAEAMNRTCIDAPPGTDELALAGLATLPSLAVAPPRIASAPVAMECRLFQAVEAGQTTIVLAEVLHLHIADRFVDPVRLHVDAPAMDLVARLHGAGWYGHAPEMFQMARPRWADQAGEG
ncbi:MAG TPA: flavin reductase family protein [Novosphingobium sp.]|nr:flavin reductase family protein [Novosphingobium sp.]